MKLDESDVQLEFELIGNNKLDNKNSRINPIAIILCIRMIGLLKYLTNLDILLDNDT